MLYTVVALYLFVLTVQADQAVPLNTGQDFTQISDPTAVQGTNKNANPTTSLNKPAVLPLPDKMTIACSKRFPDAIAMDVSQHGKTCMYSCSGKTEKGSFSETSYLTDYTKCSSEMSCIGGYCVHDDDISLCKQYYPGEVTSLTTNGCHVSCEMKGIKKTQPLRQPPGRLCVETYMWVFQRIGTCKFSGECNLSTFLP